MITKIQKLSAIHNDLRGANLRGAVVYDYKDTKIVSNSQPFFDKYPSFSSCL